MVLIPALFLIVLIVILLTVLPGWLRQRRVAGTEEKYFSPYKADDDPALTGGKMAPPPDPAHRLDRPF
jgi:hypothetical protein